MSIETQRGGYRCRKCNTPFSAETPVNVPIDVWVAHMNAMRCPECGAGIKHLSMGMGLTEEEDAARRVSGSIERRASNWLLHGDTGLSSKTVCRFFLTGYRDNPSTPSDPSDLVRCILLLEHVPEWKSRMGELAVLPGWERLAPEWDDLVALLRSEAPELNGKAPNTYERIQHLTSRQPA